MQLLSSRASQRISSSLKLLRHAPPSPTSPAASASSFMPRCCFAVSTLQTRSNLQKTQQRAIPRDFLRWAALGAYRTSRFAIGFAPLEPKPLDSIMDVGRVKVRSAEEIASVWDDVEKTNDHVQEVSSGFLNTAQSIFQIVSDALKPGVDVAEVRRRFDPDSAFFSSGNVKRELLAKQVALDLTEDERHQLQDLMDEESKC